MECRIDLEKSWFGPKEKTIVQWDEFTASIFTYSTGVEAIRLRNSRGEIVMIPFQGQQIWDIRFDRRNAKMSCMFEEPRFVDLIVDTYGAFMYHCGALRMGNPGPEDDHPMHGELPCAKYHEAALVLGEDESGPYFGLTGTFHYKKGFGDFYDATPRLLLRVARATVDMSMRVENVSHFAMDLMYMAHFNFRIGDGARIVQSSGWSTDDMILRSSIPSFVKPTTEYLALMDRVKADPKETEVFRKGVVYDPEILFNLRNMQAGKDGLAHVLQVHTDGTADNVAYDPKILNRHCRWILKNENQQVLGILPATAESEGYTAEKKKGNVRRLDGGESVVFAVTAGVLSKEETDEMIKRLY